MSIDTRLEALREVDTATVYDVMAHMGLRDQCLSSDIRPLDPALSFVGRALTVRGATGAPWSKEIGPALSYELFRRVTQGTVIVIDTGGNGVSGPWGANTGMTAQTAGAAAVIIDGGTRDRRDIVEMGLPVYARFVTPVLSHEHWEVTHLGEPVRMSGQTTEKVLVNNADIVHGDGDGVVIVPADIVDVVAGAAQYAQSVEREINDRLRKGESREDVDRACDRWAWLRREGLYVEASPRLGTPLVGRAAEKGEGA